MLRFAPFLLPLLLISCSDAARVDIRMHGPLAFEPDSLGEVTIRIREAESGDQVGGLGSTTAGSDEPALEGVSLNVGERYLVELRAVAPRCDAGVAVGRSLPFVHEEGGEDVDLYVACHGEAAPVLELPEPRALHAATWIEDAGKLIVTGGAERSEIVPDAENVDRQATVFEMDPATCEWAEAAPLSRPRRLHAAVELPEGLTVIGGSEGTLAPDEPDGSVEMLRGDDRFEATSLGVEMLWPRAAVLSKNGRALIAGYGEGEVGLVAYDAGSGSTERVLEGTQLGGAALVPLDGGARMLVVGGDTLGEEGPAARLYCEDACGDCDEPPCVVDLESDASPGLDWSFMTATYVPCDAGGGAVVVAGGATLEGAMPDRTTTSVDDVYCYRDVPGEIGTLVRSSEALETARHAATAELLEQVDGGFWVAIAGGMQTIESDPLPSYPDDMELVEINGCSCDVRSIEAQALPGQTHLVGHSMTRLGDGSIAIVGGVQEWEVGDGGSLNATTAVLRVR